MSGGRLTHATIMQDKSYAFTRLFKPVLIPAQRVPPTPLVRRRLKQPNQKEKCSTCKNEICVKCTPRQALNQQLELIMTRKQASEETDAESVDARVSDIEALLLSTPLFPEKERTARIIHKLNATPSSTTPALINKLYASSLSRNGKASLNLRNAFLTHLLQSRHLDEQPTDFSAQSVLQEYANPLARHSTVRIMITYTAFPKLVLLVQRMHVDVLRAANIQAALCARAWRGEEGSSRSDELAQRRVMRVMLGIGARCAVDPGVLAQFKHPHAQLRHPTLTSSAKSCTSVESLRYYLESLKGKDDLDVADVVEMYKAGRRLSDEVVCDWAEKRMSGIQLLSLNWSRARILAREYETRQIEATTALTEFNLMDTTLTDDSDKQNAQLIREREFLTAKTDLENGLKRVKTKDDIDDAIQVLDALQ